MRRSADAFISYTRHGGDLDFAVAIQAHLENDGISVWRDNEKIVSGQHFFDEIVLALQASKSVVAIISDEALKRDWVLGEIFTARAFDKIVPVVLGQPAEIPFGLPEVIQYTGPNDLDGIVSAVRTMRARPAPSRFLRRASTPNERPTIEALTRVVSWPKSFEEGLRQQRELKEASKILSESRRVDVADALAIYCVPSQIPLGLAQLYSCLSQRGTERQWRALAQLARPFDPTLMLASLERAGLNESEIEEFCGIRSIDDLLEERVANKDKVRLAFSKIGDLPPRKHATMARLFTLPPVERRRRLKINAKQLATAFLLVFVIAVAVFVGSF